MTGADASRREGDMDRRTTFVKPGAATAGAVTLGAVALLLAATSAASSPWQQGPGFPDAVPGRVASGEPLPELRLPADLELPVRTRPGLDSRLSQTVGIARREGLAAARRFAEANAVQLDPRGRADVLVHANAGSSWRPGGAVAETVTADEAVLAALEAPIRRRIAGVGGRTLGRRRNLVLARVPLDGLAVLPRASEIAWVQPAPAPRAHQQVISQGVEVTRADELQASSASYRPPGRRARVGILDTGFLGFEALLGSDLPSSVTTNSFHSGGLTAVGAPPTDRVHGTGTAEIVHDMAPEADLFLVNFDSLAANGQAVDWLVSQGVDVISYSIGWFNAGPGDGRGPVNDDVRTALNAGIEWVGSAGNAARAHWEGTYTDADGNGFHEFAPGDETNAVFLDAGQSLLVFLNWDDWFESDQDYDLFILDDDLETVAASRSFQTGSQWPVEAAGVVARAPTTVHVAIQRFDATRDVELEAFFVVARQMQYLVPAGSLTIPADTEGAVAVGATFWADDVVEFFSSLGPTTDGRIKPDITAPDGVASNAFGTFFGTSASAPHVAGAMALMRSRFGIYSLPQIREILLGRAIDRGFAGRDNEYGEGRLDLRGR